MQINLPKKGPETLACHHKGGIRVAHYYGRLWLWWIWISLVSSTLTELKSHRHRGGKKEKKPGGIWGFDWGGEGETDRGIKDKGNGRLWEAVKRGSRHRREEERDLGGVGRKRGRDAHRVYSTVLWKVAIKGFDEKCRPSKASEWQHMIWSKHEAFQRQTFSLLFIPLRLDLTFGA